MFFYSYKNKVIYIMFFECSDDLDIRIDMSKVYYPYWQISTFIYRCWQ